VSDVRDAVAAGKRVLIPRDDVPLLDWRGVGYIVSDPATGAAGYLLSGGLAGGATAKKDDPLSKAIREIASYLGFGSTALKSVLPLLRVAGKVSGFLGGLGDVVNVVSAIATYYEITARSGSPLKGAIAGGVDFLVNHFLSKAVAGMVTTLAAFGPGAAAIGVTLAFGVAFCVGQLESAFLDWLVVSARDRRRRSYLASSCPTEDSDERLGSLELNSGCARAWGVA
jgi:hypothetical protein